MNTSTASPLPESTPLPGSTSRPKGFVPAKDIAALVPMPELLDTLGIGVNTRTRRATCVLHKGTNVTAFSWTDDGRWFCFHCGQGGDKFTLVQEVRKYNFLDALRFLAALAGIEWADLNTAEIRRQLAEAKKKVEHVKAATEKLRVLEQDLLLAARDELLSLHRLGRNAGARLAAIRRGEKPRFADEEAVAWDALALTARNELRAATAYTVLAFGSEGDRARFALQVGEREHTIDEVLETGFVRGDSGAITEVCSA